MRLTVFTTTLGATDPLLPPTVVCPDVKYVCFSDQGFRRVGPYVHVPYPVGQDGAALASRRLKILANHPALGSPDVTLWHDAAFQLRCDVMALAKSQLVYADMLAFRHPHRDRIEDEAQVIADLGYMPAETVTAQVQAYRAAGFTTQTRITSTGLCLRRQTVAVQRFSERWWREVETWGYRDQMSVDYALWLSDVPVHYIPGHYRDNPYAKWHPPSVCRRPAPPRPIRVLPLSRQRQRVRHILERRRV